ncbi:RmlC-like cupin [Artomyces pyxidatus]|uniref:RmlC-like cupin n=1 Tax=Artomyces pyxidatus TaxID=48021 RepID=A0ACB8TLK0_9AGAM|nr:RmlC-like cupin [Artomyces pyxidatus]
MFKLAFISTFALGCTSAVKAQAPSVAQLVASLRQAPTEVDRMNLLQDSDLLFNFLAPPSGVTTGSGGHTVAATSGNFPGVVGNGVSMTIGFLGPCGMNTPHTHPRATEINFSLNTTLRGGVLVENGARFIDVEIAPGSATVFPQGAIHFEMNPSCEPAMFVAGFNNEDPGVQQVGQRYFGLPPDIVGAALGGLGVTEILGLESKIPDNVAYGVDECLQRCGITRGNQPTAQLQPVDAGNSPSGISSVPAAASSTVRPVSSSAKPASSSARPAPSSSAPAPSSILSRRPIGIPIATSDSAPFGARAVETNVAAPEVTSFKIRA